MKFTEECSCGSYVEVETGYDGQFITSERTQVCTDFTDLARVWRAEHRHEFPPAPATSEEGDEGDGM